MASPAGGALRPGGRRPHASPRRDVVQFLRQDPGLRRARSQHPRDLSVADWLAEPQRMQPVAAAATWDVPALESAGALADWLSLEPRELEWFADLKWLARASR